MNKKDTVILFDLDGTLIDSTEAIISCFYHAFNELNFDFDGNEDDIKELIGYPLDIMFQSLGVSQDVVWDFVDSYKKRYREISRDKTILLENAFEAVKLASSFARVSVVTTKTRIYSTPLLEHLGLLDFFEVIIGREDVQNPKPHPEPIKLAMEKMNVDETTHNIWMVGDTKLDLISASESNINSVGVLCGYALKEELEEFTKFIKKDSLEAVEFIKENII